MHSLFSDITILDCSQIFSGPFATRHFADMGAKVIKIESPSGDPSRSYPPKKGAWSGYFEVLNRNKESICIDLKTKEGKEILYKLCKKADVLVENFSPEVPKKLGIDYTTIQKINPRIIYASIYGISPNISRKYFDVIAQAESGLMSLNGTENDMKISTSVVDAFSGMKLAYSISSALFAREHTQKGCKIDVSMKGCAFDLLEQNLIESSLSGKNPPKAGNMDTAIAPFGIFKTGEGNIVLAIGTDAQWDSFTNFLNQQISFDESLFSTNQDRLKNITQLQKSIETAFQGYSALEIFQILQKKGIPCARIQTMTDVLECIENFDEGLLQNIYHPERGKYTVPTGGIHFSEYSPIEYSPTPSFPKQ